MCIIAGYEKELKTQFFSMNPGLERRFPWWFRLEPYNTGELVKIFKYQVDKRKWKCSEEVTDRWLDGIIGRKKELFSPINVPNVGMYVCGPTVYNFVHFGSNM